MVTLTARAAQQVRSMQVESAQPTKRLRVFVESGGCSGFQYGMSFDESKPDDTVIESEGVPMLLDPASLAYLSGSQIDFDDGFTVKASTSKIPTPRAPAAAVSPLIDLASLWVRPLSLVLHPRELRVRLQSRT